MLVSWRGRRRGRGMGFEGAVDDGGRRGEGLLMF